MCIELNIIRSVLHIEPTSSLFTQPTKRTNEFRNRTCVFIRPTCVTLSRNKKFEATLTHVRYSVHQCIHKSITENIDTNHFKNWLKYLLVCALSKFSQFNPRVDNYMFKVLCTLGDIELACLRGQNAHAK